MKVQVLIDLLYDSGKAQQAAADIRLIEEATRGADTASQLLNTHFSHAEAALSGFGTHVGSVGAGAAAAVASAGKAGEALLDVGRGLGTAGEAAGAAMVDFMKAEASLDEVRAAMAVALPAPDVAPAAGAAAEVAKAFERAGASLDGVRAGLAAALPAPDVGPAKGAALEAVAAFERAQADIARIAAGFGEASGRQVKNSFEQLRAEMARVMAEPLPAPDLRAIKAAARTAEATFEELQAAMASAMAEPIGTGSVAGFGAAVEAALKDEARLAGEAHAAIAAPAADGALASVEATVAALKEQLTLEEEIRRLMAQPVPPAIRPPAPAGEAPWTFPNGAAVPPIAPGHGEPGGDVPPHAPPTLPPVMPPAAPPVAPPAPLPPEPPLPKLPSEDRPPPKEPSGGGGMGGLLEGFVGFAEVGTGYKLAEGIVHQAGEAQTIDAQLRAAGVPEAEIGEMHGAASRISRDSKMYSVNDAMDLLRDGRAVLGSTDDAVKLADDVTRATAIAESVSPGHGKEGAFDIIKAAEAAGKTKDAEGFHAFVDQIAKNTEVFRDKVPLRNYREFFQHAGAAGQHVPADFMGGALPHLLQEYGGDSVGTMYNMMDRAVVGGITTKKALDSFRELGLIDEKKVHDDGKGHMRLDAGAIKGTEGPNFNPFTWANDVYEKALDEHGLSKEEKEHHYQADFSNSNVAGAVAKMVEQKGIIEKDAKQIEAAHGLAGADELQRSDPHLANEGLMGQLRTFEKNAGDGLMRRVVPMENTLSDLFAHANSAMEAAPGSAAAVGAGVIGGLGYAGWKTLEHGVFDTLKWGARGVGAAAVPLTAGLFVTDAMLNQRDHDKAMIEGAHPDMQPQDYDTGLPGLENVPELARPPLAPPRPAAPAPPSDALPDWTSFSRAANGLDAPKPTAPDLASRAAGDPVHVVVDGDRPAPLAPADAPHVDWRPPFGSADHPAGASIPMPLPPLPDFLRHAPGEPIHVVVDGDRTPKAPGDAPHVDWRPPFGTAARPAGAPIAIPSAPPPTGGTAAPSLAQPAGPVTNNNQQTTNVTNHYQVNAPVTVNVAAPAAAPAAVGGAVAAAVTSAVKQSPGVLHDGYGPH